MRNLFTRRRHAGRHRAPTIALDDLLPGRGAGFSVTDQACCCPARPVVMVILPVTATRRSSVDLLLCGHHFRASESALRAAGASVYDATGAPVSAASAANVAGAGRFLPAAGVVPAPRRG